MTSEVTLTAADFRLASCQATLFTPDEEISTAKLLSGFLPSWFARFDADPVVLPSVQAVPREMPRMILSSSDGVWRCEIAAGRMNIFWRGTKSDAPPPSLGSFYTDASSLLTQYSSFMGSRMGRLAAVTTRYARHDSPGVFLAAHFCQDRWRKAPLNRPENFELHAHKRFDMAGLTVNSWVRNKTGNLAADGKAGPIVLVEQDMNTLGEEAATRRFTADDVAKFFSLVSREFEHILELYYPRG